MKKINEVFETTDYEIFKKLEGNRVLNRVNLSRLRKSFRDRHLIAPITVNQNYEIIDGQHRMAASAAEGKPVHFIIVDDYGLEEVRILNTNMKNWTKEDYLNGFCDLGYPEYLKFRNFMRQFPSFSIKTCEYLISSKKVQNPDKITRRDMDVGANKDGTNIVKHNTFKEGGLIIEDLEGSIDKARKVMMLKPYFEFYNRSTFVLAMVHTLEHKNYNHSRFLAKVKKFPAKMYSCHTLTENREMIEEVYNYHSGDKVTLRY